MQIFIYFPQKQHPDNLIQNILFSCFLFKPFIYNILSSVLLDYVFVYFACFRDFHTSPNEPRTTFFCNMSLVGCAGCVFIRRETAFSSTLHPLTIHVHTILVILVFLSFFCDFSSCSVSTRQMALIWSTDGSRGVFKRLIQYLVLPSIDSFYKKSQTQFSSGRENETKHKLFTVSHICQSYYTVRCCCFCRYYPYFGLFKMHAYK